VKKFLLYLFDDIERSRMDINRRSFLGTALGAAAMSGCRTAATVAKVPEYDFKWIDLIHFGMKMWGDIQSKKVPNRNGQMMRLLTDEEFAAVTTPERRCINRMHFEAPFWNDLSLKLRQCGCNCIMLDVGEGMIYESHPELQVEGSWSQDRLKSEIDRLRGMGFEVIPKLNFSTTHDSWLGPYERMVSTPKYYEVCADLIRDTMDVFGPVKHFHIGFDEEELVNYQKLQNENLP
jgi:hypothetical protein